VQDGSLDLEQVADHLEREGGLARMVVPGLEEVPSEVAPATRSDQADLARREVELGAEVGEQNLPLEVGEELRWLFAALRVREPDDALLSVAVRPQAAAAELAVEAVLHGVTGVVE